MYSHVQVGSFSQAAKEKQPTYGSDIGLNIIGCLIILESLDAQQCRQKKSKSGSRKNLTQKVVHNIVQLTRIIAMESGETKTGLRQIFKWTTPFFDVQFVDIKSKKGGWQVKGK